MSNKRLAVILVAITVVVIGGFGVWKLTSKNSPAPEVTVTSESNKTYTTAEVAEHKTQSDCWTTIRGNVYDITTYVSSHPGGSQILDACGQDATSLFEQRTTSTGDSVGSGTPHSSSAQAELERLKIGTIRQ